jgi:hypothetical protein
MGKQVKKIQISPGSKAGLRPGAPTKPMAPMQPQAPTSLKNIPSTPSTVPFTQKKVVPGKPGK